MAVVKIKIHLVVFYLQKNRKEIMHSSPCSEEKNLKQKKYQKNRQPKRKMIMMSPPKHEGNCLTKATVSLLEVSLIQFESKEEKGLFYKWFWLFERDAGLFVICFGSKKKTQAFCTFFLKKRITIELS
ncbi:hypothetical protein RFI_02769 [Reticulomyxa filosa]|uniref:Uncharacterized protein n=1 Tax=Reticulomyxa filosa TaxID=46433 RepID=X6P701_RETFI|nr:hypothetical protein RFI_02769 [Reticulomyxa filosa]|eukprot:ETO34325.1 hypothetical protein RFI_02769 [Reticulomyxa filosa]